MDKNFAIVLPLRKAVRIDPSDLIGDIRLMVEQAGATVALDPRALHQAQPSRKGLLSFGKRPPEIFAFDIDGVRIRVSTHHEPFVQRRDIARYVNPARWDRGLGEFSDHRAYIKIYETGIDGEEGLDSIFDRAAAVTVTGSVVARLVEPIGAIWTAARNSLPVDGFADALRRLEGGAAPIDFWLRWQIIPPSETEDAHSGLITCGLGAFLGFEICARPSGTETREMIDHAMELARRMIDEQFKVKDGDEFDSVNDEPVRVRIGPGRRRGDTPVCEIALVNGPKSVPKPVYAPTETSLGPALPGAVAKSAEEIVREVLEGKAVLPPPGVSIPPPPLPVAEGPLDLAGHALVPNPAAPSVPVPDVPAPATEAAPQPLAAPALAPEPPRDNGPPAPAPAPVEAVEESAPVSARSEVAEEPPAEPDPAFDPALDRGPDPVPDPAPDPGLAQPALPEVETDRVARRPKNGACAASSLPDTPPIAAGEPRPAEVAAATRAAKQQPGPKTGPSKLKRPLVVRAAGGGGRRVLRLAASPKPIG